MRQLVCSNRNCGKRLSLGTYLSDSFTSCNHQLVDFEVLNTPIPLHILTPPILYSLNNNVATTSSSKGISKVKWIILYFLCLVKILVSWIILSRFLPSAMQRRSAKLRNGSNRFWEKNSRPLTRMPFVTAQSFVN